MTNETRSGWRQLGPGIRMRRLIHENDTALRLYRLEAGSSFAFHHHPSPEMGLILAGSGALLLPEGDQAIEAGDSYYVPGGIPHGFRVAEGAPVVLIDVETGTTRSDPLEGLVFTARPSREGVRAPTRPRQ